MSKKEVRMSVLYNRAPESEATPEEKLPMTNKHSEKEIAVHPVQNHQYRGGAGQAPQVVTLAAYEVYSEVFGAQPAMIDMEGRGCRGGFGAGELIAFLYARSFPRKEWRQRVYEATEGMKNL